VGAATVFVATYIAKSTAHYRDALGFTVTMSPIGPEQDATVQASRPLNYSEEPYAGPDKLDQRLYFCTI